MRGSCRLRCHSSLWPILAATVAFIVPSLTAWAVEPITISLVPVSTEIEIDGLNDPLVIDVRIDNPEQELVKSWSLDLCFDPAVFDPLPGIGLVPAQGFELGDYIPGAMGQWNNNYEANGVSPDIARMGALNFGTQTGSAVTGLLGQVSIDAIGTSPGSTLWLQGQIILFGGGAAENVVFQSSQIIVNTPEPATAILLLAGLCLCRRKSHLG